MTHRNYLLVLAVTIVWLEGISGAAYSNVVVQRDGVLPLEYFNYGPSSLQFVSPQAAQLSASPLETVVQLPSVSGIVSPCLAPCIYPNTGSQGPISASNAKIITYNSAVPNVPVVITDKEAARPYQYAYAVYDDHTGDKKSQSEQSDGSAVQGQYSFIQPDGFRREVVYTADDLKGFNAVVRNIAPEPEQQLPEYKEIPQPAPCPEPQNAQLTQSHEQGLERAIPEIEHLEDSKNEPKHVQKGDEISVGKIAKNIDKNPKAEKAEKEETRQSDQAIGSSFPLLNNVVSYNDIIKCLQAKLINVNSAASPLTYILIPSLNGPC